MKNLPLPAYGGWSRCQRSWVQRLVENGPLDFGGESILKLWDAIFQNVISGAESCKPFLSIGISKKFPLTESLILQSKPTLCTFHHHPVYRDKFSSIYRKIKCCGQENRCCIDKSWTLFDKKKEVCELRACHKKDNKDTKLDNKKAILRKWDNDFSSIKHRQSVFR